MDRHSVANPWGNCRVNSYNVVFTKPNSEPLRRVEIFTQAQANEIGAALETDGLGLRDAIALCNKWNKMNPCYKYSIPFVGSALTEGETRDLPENAELLMAIQHTGVAPWELPDSSLWESAGTYGGVARYRLTKLGFLQFAQLNQNFPAIVLKHLSNAQKTVDEEILAQQIYLMNVQAFDIGFLHRDGNARWLRVNAQSGYQAIQNVTGLDGFVNLIKCEPMALSSVPRFKVGDLIRWINDYGVAWFNRTVIRVDQKDGQETQYAIEPHDAPWTTISEHQMEFEPGSAQKRKLPTDAEIETVRSSHRLYTRDVETGYPCRDGLVNRDYKPIPLATAFQNGLVGSSVPTVVFGWQWSVTFGRWSALCRFADGWQGFTYPVSVRPAITDDFEASILERNNP